MKLNGLGMSIPFNDGCQRNNMTKVYRSRLEMFVAELVRVQETEVSRLLLPGIPSWLQYI